MRAPPCSNAVTGTASPDALSLLPRNVAIPTDWTGDVFEATYRQLRGHVIGRVRLH
jgi:hypothetical protein